MCLSVGQSFYVPPQGIMHLTGKPVASFDPEGLIFSVGVESKMVKLYDLRSFDKVCMCDIMTTRDCPRCTA